MNTSKLKEDLKINNISFEENVPLAPFTTWKIGGPADIFIRLSDPSVLPLIASLAKQSDTPITFLGSGSNVLIHDQGIRGLVIRNEYTGIIINENTDSNNQQLSQTDADITEPEARLLQLDTKEYYDFSKLDYDESTCERVKVTIKSGTLLSYSINYLISNGITGLQWFAGIPGTIGGAIYNNIHGGSHFFSEYLDSIEVINEEGNSIKLAKSEIGIEYDNTKLQDSFNFITEAHLSLPKGDKSRALKTAIAWATAKKAKQPYNSGGCSFKNITTEERKILNLESDSWGYIIDHVLQLKGLQIGGAKISNLHAAFIENTGNATSEDVIAIMNHIFEQATKKLQGITPKTEIFFLGFPQKDIEKFL